MGTKLSVLVDVVQCFYSKRSKKFKGYAVTEGKFKALHLARRGYTVLSVRGVGNWERCSAYAGKHEGEGTGDNRL